MIATTTLVRGVFLLLGLVFTLLGFVGVFLPVMPTTPFLLVAAACFARSSTRLEAWLLAQPHFGPLLRNWRDHGAIPRYAKWLSLGGSSLGFGMFLLAGPSWILALVVGAGIAAAMVFVFSRPDV
ncbi:YbaN family protein [Paenirhodobacter sp.]|uniref:YbaN family protein n=1 Tax=Paenirhodobacter sp. TaxID=1965326 RepID=UPI003B4162E5